MHPSRTPPPTPQARRSAPRSPGADPSRTPAYSGHRQSAAGTAPSPEACPRRRPALAIAAAVVIFVLALAAVLLVAHAAAAGEGTAPPSSSPGRMRFDPLPSAGHPLVTLPWGSGPGAVGLDPAGEGLRRAPWALAVAPDGRLAVLDVVNDRLVLLSARGEPLGTIPSGLADARFLAVDDARIHVLDADAERRVASFDWSGTLLAKVDLPELDEPISGLLIQEGAPVVETAHTDVYVIHPGDTPELDLLPVDPEDPTVSPPADRAPRSPAKLRPIVGRPLRSQRFGHVRGSFAPPDRVRLQLTPRPTSDRMPPTKRPAPADEPAPSVDRAAAALDATVVLPEPIEHLVSLDGDGRDGIIVGVRLLRNVGSESAPLMVSRLSAGYALGVPSAGVSGTPTAAPSLLLTDGGIGESGQPYAVGPDGSVYQARATADGYAIRVHTFPEE
jgi:hypothetical protein